MVSARTTQPGGRHLDEDAPEVAPEVAPELQPSAPQPVAPRGGGARRRSIRRLWASGITALVVSILLAAVVVVRVTADRETAQAALRSDAATSASSVASAERAAAARVARGGTTSFQDPHPSAAPVFSTATPTRLTIASIAVDAGLQTLKIDAAGVLQAPTSFTKAGWFAAGVRPGNIGPAVVAGHFDAASGPAVFDSLRLVRPGAEIDIARSDGTTARFAVTRSAFVRKALFPSSAVYGPTPDAQLRLITCGGAYNRSLGHYDENLVVFATLI